MKAHELSCKDLMIGDSVLVKPSKMLINIVATHHNKVAYHSCTNRLIWVGEGLLEPVILTPEILKKNGFEEWDGWYVYSIDNVAVEIAWTGTILKIGGQCGNLELPDIMYVHQLQHALRLCGIEKEIKL